jgi:hypothetical protein
MECNLNTVVVIPWLVLFPGLVWKERLSLGSSDRLIGHGRTFILGHSNLLTHGGCCAAGVSLLVLSFTLSSVTSSLLNASTVGRKAQKGSLHATGLPTTSFGEFPVIGQHVLIILSYIVSRKDRGLLCFWGQRGVEWTRALCPRCIFGRAAQTTRLAGSTPANMTTLAWGIYGACQNLAKVWAIIIFWSSE